MSVATEGNRRYYIGADPYPGQTRAIELLFSHLGPQFGTRAYADLSAVAHSMLAAFAVPVPVEVPAAELPAAERETPIERGVVIAVAAYDITMHRFLKLYGWGDGPWDGFVREAHAEMRRLIGVPPGLIDIVRVRRD